MVRTISKEELSVMPMEKFEGRIIVVQSESEAEKAAAYLKKQTAIGFDTETRPAFRKGVSHQIALMQLSTDDTCFLFRLNIIGLPDCLADILIDPAIKKIGLSLKDDFSAIHKRNAAFVPSNFIELQSFVKSYGIEDNGLQRIYGILFEKRISKGQRLSNWEADVLSDAQKMYAAIDAWACLRIYNELKVRKKTAP
ncbi:MAG: 3'-5' exonuclease domain-containing protein 2 [Prevotella sp.]|jgi:ribonuclease D|uniref:3'-5' exonuclease n=1 Tax=unclassified Dysgonomonas TaxID=2630389 RepID=UPI0025B8FA56|nr:MULTISPECIES: 3'-5' exonuclease [unclassified Dysgonomonas]MDR1717276.1 3'-5' exonuclease domain-containing protein 2 [Prevotella sp.]MDR2001603.1 3'-5' exonuclease domain-containing protein 2 [Prevotella sp.]HMM04596.1 3'-5' exonuclease [Dysgonomonas sp.]